MWMELGARVGMADVRSRDCREVNRLFVSELPRMSVVTALELECETTQDGNINIRDG